MDPACPDGMTKPRTEHRVVVDVVGGGCSELEHGFPDGDRRMDGAVDGDTHGVVVAVDLVDDVRAGVGFHCEWKCFLFLGLAAASVGERPVEEEPPIGVVRWYPLGPKRHRSAGWLHNSATSLLEESVEGSTC